MKIHKFKKVFRRSPSWSKLSIVRNATSVCRRFLELKIAYFFGFCSIFEKLQIKNSSRKSAVLPHSICSRCLMPGSEPLEIQRNLLLYRIWQSYIILYCMECPFLGRWMGGGGGLKRTLRGVEMAPGERKGKTKYEEDVMKRKFENKILSRRF